MDYLLVKTPDGNSYKHEIGGELLRIGRFSSNDLVLWDPHVSRTHASFASIIKTIELILDIPFLNQYDAAANDLSDFLTAEPDFEPYTAVAVDPRIFDPEKALDPLDPEFFLGGFEAGYGMIEAIIHFVESFMKGLVDHCPEFH